MHPTRMYDYLTQARTMLFDWVRPLSEEQYRTEHPIGLGSLARTLHHTHAAEWSYMRRIRGETGPLETAPLEHEPEITTEQALAFASLEQRWIDQAKATRSDLEGVTDWETPRVYTTIWEERPYQYRASCFDIFSQIVTHEVHHRTQALHMLRRLGVSTGEIDYNALMWEQVDAP